MDDSADLMTKYRRKYATGSCDPVVWFCQNDHETYILSFVFSVSFDCNFCIIYDALEKGRMKEPMAPWRCHMMSHQKLIKKAISISIGNNSWLIGDT